MTWYEDDKLWENFYHCMFDDDSFAQAQQQIPEILSLTNTTINDVLDLGCGPGRHCIAFAKMGFNVTGIDTSEFLLTKARAKSQNLSIDYIKTNMLDYLNPNGFDLIVNMFNSFGYFDTHIKNQQVIDNAFINLKSNGCFIIDTVGKEILARTIEPVHLTEHTNGDLRIERPLFINDMKVFSNQWILISGDKAFKRSYQHFVYTPVELSTMCKKAGFNNVSCYGSLSADEYNLGSERLIIVAEKNGK